MVIDSKKASNGVIMQLSFSFYFTPFVSTGNLKI